MLQSEHTTSLTTCSTVRHVVRAFGPAAHRLVRGCRKLKFPLSIVKTAFVSNSREMSQQLQSAWSEFGFERVDTTRNVGTSATGGKVRRVGIQRERQAAAHRRGVRLLMLQSGGAKVTLAHRAGLLAGALCGSPAAGLPPS